MRIHLQLLNGEKIDRSIDLDTFTIGRSAKCEVVVPHEGMSRQHCQIELIQGEVHITDLGSTNGVFIDGERIEPHKKTPYATYLTLAFGAVQSMTIQLTEPSQTLNFQNSMPKKEMPKEIPSAGNTTVMTKTKSMQDPSKPSEKNSVKKPQSTTINFRSIFINLICLMIIGAAVWWYTQNKDGAPSEATEEYTEESSAE